MLLPLSRLVLVLLELPIKLLRYRRTSLLRLQALGTHVGVLLLAGQQSFSLRMGAG
jgi:hypothetical protein